jgi:DNA-directed RNA polymerase specialized sigma24 family protein
LNDDRDLAAVEYEHLRRALIKFFDWRGAWLPEDCADETIDRLSRKLGEIAIADVKAYAHGIARMVLLERRRAPVFASIEAGPVLQSPVETPPSENSTERQQCFDDCLAQIPGDGRSLLLGYYEGERQSKIVNRRRMAVALGLSENALRSRVQRLRNRIDQCVHACVATRTGTSL